MAKTAVSQWDTTAANNLDINSISLAENVMQPPAVNDAFREMMAQIAAGVVVKIAATTTVAAYFQLAEATNNGTNKLTITPADSLTADRTATFPDASGTVYLIDQAFVAPAGTTSLTPVKLQSGTLNTTAAAGGLEYDGKAFYATSVASSRQVVQTPQIVSNGSAVALSNSSTSAQSIFPSANDTLTLGASTTYRYRARIISTNGTTGHAVNIGFGGTATFTSFLMYLEGLSGGSATSLTGIQRGYTTSAGGTSATIGSVTTPVIVVLIEGVMRVNGAGTIIPQITYSAGPGGTCQIEPNSYFEIWPVGSDTVAAVGNWA